LWQLHIRGVKKGEKGFKLALLFGFLVSILLTAKYVHSFHFVETKLNNKKDTALTAKRFILADGRFKGYQ